MKMIVIYHANCIDGFTAAYVAWCEYGGDAVYVPAQYGEPPPEVVGKDVLVVDFSYPRTTLEKMAAEAKSIRVLDHHKTAEADLSGLPFCTFDMLRSGAGLAWDELHGGERPALVDYVEDRDLWNWKLPDSREVSAWLSSFKPDFHVWETLAGVLQNDRPVAVGQGTAILRALNGYVDSLSQKYAVHPIGGHAVPVINTTHAISELVGQLASLTGVPFAAGWFQRHDGKFVYSLRSRGDFDVSEVAKRFGGGGHKNAAGFTVDALVHDATPPNPAGEVGV